MGEQASPPAKDKDNQRTAAEIILDPVKRYQGLTPGLTVTGEINAETKARITADMDAALKEFLRANPNGEIEVAGEDGTTQKYKMNRDGSAHLFRGGKFEETSSGKVTDPADNMSALLIGSVVEIETKKLQSAQHRNFEIQQLRLVDQMAGTTGARSGELLRDIKNSGDKGEATAKMKQALPAEKHGLIDYYMNSLWRMKEAQASIGPDARYAPYAANDPSYQKITALNDIVHGLGRGEDTDTLKYRTEISKEALADVKINDRLFSPELYAAFDKKDGKGYHEPSIKAELLGFPPGTRDLTRLEVCEIARERFIQRAASEGIDQRDISKAMFEGRFNLSKTDLHLVYRGGSPSGDDKCTAAWNRDFLPKRADRSDGTLADLKGITLQIPQGYKPGGNYDVQTVTGVDGKQLLQMEADRRQSSFDEKSICAFTYMGGRFNEPGIYGWDMYQHLREKVYYPGIQKEHLGAPTIDPKKTADDAIANAPKPPTPDPATTTPKPADPSVMVRPAA